MLGNIHLILAIESCCACLYDTHDVGLPTQFRLNVVPGQCRQIVYDAGPTLLQHWVCCILKHCHLPSTVLLLAQRLCCWPNNETGMGDCPVFAWTAVQVTLFYSRLQKSHYPDNTIHWPNADVMLGHRL